MFQKRSGEVVKRFRVEIDGSLDGDKLILDEHFRYSDGTTQRRVWTLTEDTPGRWRGTAADVIGEARGEVSGNSCAGAMCSACRWMTRSTVSTSTTGCTSSTNRPRRTALS